MASPKMFAEVVIAGSYKNLSKATRGAQGKDGRKNAISDISRAQAEYGKYYSATELLMATGIKKVANIAAGGSNMSNVGSKPTTMHITVNGAVSGNEVVTALTRYARGKGIPMSKLLK